MMYIDDFYHILFIYGLKPCISNPFGQFILRVKSFSRHLKLGFNGIPLLKCVTYLEMSHPKLLLRVKLFSRHLELGFNGTPLLKGVELLEMSHSSSLS